MAAQLRSTFDGSTMVLTIVNPEQRNALGPEVHAAGVEALNAVENNPDVRAVVITGEGRNFSSGGNLRLLQAQRRQDHETQLRRIEGLHSWIETIRTFPRPVIAAIEGVAAGSGLSLALACDLIVAARNASFVSAFAAVGLSPDAGISWQLRHGLPRQLATALLMDGERIGAERLQQLGLVGRVCEAGNALSTALGWAADLATRPPNVLTSIKELLAAAPGQSLHQQLADERDHFLRNLLHPNAGIGMAAFLDKQAARYK